MNRMIDPVTGRLTRRHLLGLGSAAIGTAATLSACSAGDGGSSADDALTMLNHSRGQEETLAALIEKYEEETGVRIELDTPGPADYPAKLQSLNQSGRMPDLYTVISAADMAPYYKGGYAEDLTELLDAEWGDDFAPAVLELSAFSDDNALEIPAGTYGAFWEITTYGLLVNPELVDVDPSAPPATLEELIDALAAAGGGTGLFSIAASLAPEFVQTVASTFLTDEEIDATLSGKADWTTDAWRNAFGVLETMRDAGVIANSSLPGGSDDNSKVEQSFFNARSLGAIFDGSFAIAVARSTAPDFTDYFSLPLPAAADGIHEPRAMGATGRGAAVNAKSDKVEEALAFLRWMTGPDRQQIFAEETGVIPTNPYLLENAEVPDQLAGLATAVSTLEIVPAQFTGDVRDVIVRGSQSIVLGEKTVDQVLDEVQAAQGAS